MKAELLYSDEAALAQVLEFVPDVEPLHAKSLCRQFSDEHKTRTHEVVIHTLLENPQYPKVTQPRDLLAFILCSDTRARWSGNARNQRTIVT